MKQDFIDKPLLSIEIVNLKQEQIRNGIKISEDSKRYFILSLLETFPGYKEKFYPLLQKDQEKLIPFVQVFSMIYFYLWNFCFFLKKNEINSSIS